VDDQPSQRRLLVRHNAIGRRLRIRSDALIIRPLAEGAHDSARMTEIPLMSSLFTSTID
jgi:hypothetical protein